MKTEHFEERPVAEALIAEATHPAYTAPTEDDMLARAAKTVEAYVLTCRYCDGVTPVCKDIPTLVERAKKLGMIVVNLDAILMGGPTVVCAECAKRTIASFRRVEDGGG